MQRPTTPAEADWYLLRARRAPAPIEAHRAWLAARADGSARPRWADLVGRLATVPGGRKSRRPASTPSVPCAPGGIDVRSMV